MTRRTRHLPLAVGVANLAAPCMLAQPAWPTKPVTVALAVAFSHGGGAETPDLWGDDFCRSMVGETKRWPEGVKTSGAKPD